MSSISNFIRKIDFFGSSYKFTVNREKRFHSIYGGLSSICVSIIFAIYLAFRIKEFILQENIVKDYNVVTFKSPKVNLATNGKFTIVTCVTNPTNFTAIDNYADSALNHTMIFEEVYRRPWLIEFYENIEIKQCQLEDFPSGFLSPPLFQKFSQCKCVPHRLLQKYKLLNYWTEEYYTLLKYSIKFKDEIYNDPAKVEEFTKYYKLNNPRMITFFIETDIDINANMHEDPLLESFNLDASYVNVDFTQITNIFLKTLSYDTDLAETQGIN